MGVQVVDERVRQHGIPDAESRQAVRLRERARDEEGAMTRDERDHALAGEPDEGLVAAP